MNNEADCEIANEDKAAYYQVYIEYQGFSNQPQNGIPIEQIPKNTFYSTYIGFNSNQKSYTLFTWNIIRYQDYNSLSIFQNKEEEELRENDIYIGGNIKRFDIFQVDNSYIYKNNYRFVTKFTILHFPNTYEFEYEDYKRKKKFILTPIANCCSLCITLYNVLVFLFGYLYSNYLIISK